MKEIIKVFAVILLIFMMFFSFSYAASFKSTLLRVERKTIAQFSDEYRNLIRERDRIEAQIQLILRSEKIDSEELKKYLKQLEDLDYKIYAEFKKDFINRLSNALKLREEQAQKVKDILNKYMDEIRNLRERFRWKNLEMRALEKNEENRQKEIREEICKIRDEIKEKQRTMFRELSQTLDRKQFIILTRLMQRYNIRLRVKVF